MIMKRKAINFSIRFEKVETNWRGKFSERSLVARNRSVTIDPLDTVGGSMNGTGIVWFQRLYIPSTVGR